MVYRPRMPKREIPFSDGEKKEHKQMPNSMRKRYYDAIADYSPQIANPHIPEAQRLVMAHNAREELEGIVNAYVAANNDDDHEPFLMGALSPEMAGLEGYYQAAFSVASGNFDILSGSLEPFKKMTDHDEAVKEIVASAYMLMGESINNPQRLMTKRVNNMQPVLRKLLWPPFTGLFALLLTTVAEKAITAGSSSHDPVKYTAELFASLVSGAAIGYSGAAIANRQHRHTAEREFMRLASKADDFLDREVKPVYFAGSDRDALNGIEVSISSMSGMEDYNKIFS